MQRYNFDLIIISDRAASGVRADETIPAVKTWCSGKVFRLHRTAIVPDDTQKIRLAILTSVAEKDCNLIITSGGTGCAPRDITPEVTRGIVEKLTPGIDEYLRSTGMAKTIFSALSRGISGIVSDTLIINLPGNPQAVTEGLENLQKILPHAIRIMTNRAMENEHRTDQDR